MPNPTNAVTTEEAYCLCKMGQHAACCRYLSMGSGAGYTGFLCLKHDKPLATVIDRRVASGTFNARGDLCPGKPVR